MVAVSGSCSADGACLNGRGFKACNLDSGNGNQEAEAPSELISPIFIVQEILCFVLMYFEHELSTLLLFYCKRH